MAGQDSNEHYYQQRDASANDTFRPLPTMIPRRKPVGGSADPAPEVGYPLQPARTVSSRSQMPQRMGTISSGGKFTVSPASSIHEDEDEYGVPTAPSLPSPQHYRDPAQAQSQASWGGGGIVDSQAGLWNPQHATAIDGNVRAEVPRLWQTEPDPSEIPYPETPHWRGSRELQELYEARARAQKASRGPARTPHRPGADLPPASVPVSVSVPAPAHAAGNQVPPLPSAAPSWHNPQQTQQPRGNAQGAGNNGTAPFMHYENLDYFLPAPDSEPKDESQIDGAVPRADTFPEVMEGMNRPTARRSWDRQRKRRRKKMGPENGDGGEHRGRGRQGGCGACFRYCTHWLPEIMWCLVSIACLVVIVAVLKTYDGRGLTDWPLTVSLNTLVAFLVAICEVAMAVPLAEGLSQLKWNSFARGEKPLADFQTFEDAKRGPAGSAMLLCKRKGRALGVAAATTLLTGFLVSPLTQGAISYPTRTVEAGGGTATVARSESYSHPAPYATRLSETLDTREKQAIQSGIYHAVDEQLPDLQPVCSSGNCEWRNFSSLAVCGAVADISDRLTISNQTRARSLGISLGVANDEPAREARLPNGLFLVGSTSTCNLNISWPHPSANASGDAAVADGQESFLPARTSLAFSDEDGRVSSAIANFFLVYTNQTAEVALGSQQGVFRAAEVLLHFCVNTYTVSTSRGLSITKLVHSSALAAQDTPVGLRDASTRSRRVILRAASDVGVYSVKRDDVKLLNAYLLSLFSGTYSSRYGRTIGGETATSEALGLSMFRGGLDAEAMRTVINNLTTNVATSLTNTQLGSRTPRWPETTQGGVTQIRAMSSTSETGTVLATESYVHVQWAWLSFLAIQIALSVSFLLGIMVQTAVWNVKILKGSSAAALLAIPPDDRTYLEDQENIFLDESRAANTGSQMTRKLQTVLAVVYHWVSGSIATCIGAKAFTCYGLAAKCLTRSPK
ncbi:uncharacterized protein B0T15DRAFT_507150 [Chaetomium strumarium]|uniref:Transmembrane protein n=1 Tax=Chaetomium strumarium TaxID=1170767 RepID=A0AAJ0H267_9PEZI|nr:hypothetical protein B0T15DRAFT_507150 [Chaetomium strumarium]